jgi:flagellin-specific chaperone FliS
VQSRSPLELVVMLYDGALASLTDARSAASRGDARKCAAAEVHKLLAGLRDAWHQIATQPQPVATPPL